MTECHQRFDAVLGELVEHGVVEGQALLVGRLVVPLGKIRLQAIDRRNTVKPTSAKSAMSSA
jgi:hypothetical protein